MPHHFSVVAVIFGSRQSVPENKPQFHIPLPLPLPTNHTFINLPSVCAISKHCSLCQRATGIAVPATRRLCSASFYVNFVAFLLVPFVNYPVVLISPSPRHLVLLCFVAVLHAHPAFFVQALSRTSSIASYPAVIPLQLNITLCVGVCLCLLEKALTLLCRHLPSLSDTWSSTISVS